MSQGIDASEFSTVNNINTIFSTLVGNFLEDEDEVNVLVNSTDGRIIYPYDGDDVIPLTGSKQIIQYEGGNDLIIIDEDAADYDDDGNLVEVYSSLTLKNDIGDEGIINCSSNVVITAGIGDNRYVYSRADNVTINVGGSNEIDANGSNLLIRSGDGDDRIELDESSHVSITSGAGNDAIYLSESEFVSTDAGTGDDSVEVNCTNSLTLRGGKGNDDIELDDSDWLYQYAEGDGDDTISSYNNIFGLLQIESGSISDIEFKREVEFKNEYEYAVIKVGAGSIALDCWSTTVFKDADDRVFTLNLKSDETFETIAVDSIADGVQYNSASETILTAESDVSSIVNCGAGVSIHGSDNDNAITLGGAREVIRYSAGNDTICGFNGDDRIYLGGAYVTLANRNDVIVSVIGGSIRLVDALDQPIDIRIENMTDADSLSAGIEFNPKKPSTITVKNSFLGSVDAKNFSDKVTLIDGSSDTQPLILKAGDKASVLREGSGGSTLIGGAKKDKLYGGSGADVFAYSVGNGKDVLNDVDANDVISIEGATRDQITLVDKKETVTITFDGDAKSKLTVNKINSVDPITLALDDGRFVYGQLPTGAGYDDESKKTSIKLGLSAANGMLVDANRIVSTAKTIDGSAASNSAHMIGNANANVLIASEYDSTLDGGEGNDKLYGGSGADTFIYSAGSDQIYNFDGAQGDLLLFNGINEIDSAKVVESASKVTVTIGKNKIVLENPTGEIKFVNDSGATLHSIGINLPSGVSYNKTKTSLTVDSGSTIEAIDLNAGYASKVKEINATAVGGSINLIGNDKANILRAGDHDSTLDGGAGSDKLYGGSGADVFVWNADTGGNDRIYGYDSSEGDIISVEGAGFDEMNFNRSGKNFVLKVGGNKLTINDAKDKRVEIAAVLSTGGAELPTSIEEYWFERTIETDPLEEIISIENISVDLIETDLKEKLRAPEIAFAARKK